MSKKKLKSTKRIPTATRIKQLEKRIEDASRIIGCLAIRPEHFLYDDYYAFDEAVQALQGDNYRKFVADFTAEIAAEDGVPFVHWHTGDEWKNR